MAVQAGTDLTYGDVGIREDLTDRIYDYSPQDTPLMSMIGRDRAKNTLHEWQKDKLRAPAKNRKVQGDVTSFAAPSRTARLGNYTQIVSESVLTSGTQDRVDHAGKGTATNYNLVRRGAEMKLDMEFSLFQNEGGTSGDSDTPPVLAGLPAWMQTNVDRGTGGADSGHVSGVPQQGATDGTLRTFTFAQVQDVMQQCYQNGARPNILMVGVDARVAVSDVANFGNGIAEHTVQLNTARPTFLEGSVDVLVTNFGNLRVVPNRVQSTPGVDAAGDPGGPTDNYRNRDAYLLDASVLGIDFLRPFKTRDLAIDGDISAKKLLVAEYTLRVNNEIGLGLVADIQQAP